jgi:hypothetical protein
VNATCTTAAAVGTASRPVAAGTAARRTLAAVVAVVAAGLLGLAGWLTPAGAGLGTHEQFGLPPCGWIVMIDLPCPTCGMTTAFAHAADGRMVRAFAVQPFGAALAVATAAAALLGLYVALTGSAIASVLGRLWSPRLLWAITGFALAAWAWKILVYRGWL